MSFPCDRIDPIATVVDWLDACKNRRIQELLELYDQEATLECVCEAMTITGRAALEAYWRPKLANPAPTAFELNALFPERNEVSLDYLSYSGKPIRMHFRFNQAGKILHTSCGPAAFA